MSGKSSKDQTYLHIRLPLLLAFRLPIHLMVLILPDLSTPICVTVSFIIDDEVVVLSRLLSSLVLIHFDLLENGYFLGCLY